jgi:subtilase family serine protease
MLSSRMMRLTATTAFVALLATGTTAMRATATSADNVIEHAVCGNNTTGQARCFAHVVSVNGSTSSATPVGFTPSDLRSAYNLTTNKGGSGQTIAIVDAFDNPNAEADLAVYRAQFGLPPCTTANGCFRKVDESGGANYPRPNVGWGQEISIDLDMASAICPNCHLLLVEGTSTSVPDLGTSVNTAVSLGANVVSNSYGAYESWKDAGYNQSFFNHPGVAMVVASGDSGYINQTYYPAASPYVTAVGGTTLTRTSSNSRGWSESAWAGSGSGCTDESKPIWQSDSGCSNRTLTDVSAVGDPLTGVAVYDSYGKGGGWMEFGGTSVAAPIIAGVYALAGNEVSLNGASLTYSNSSALNDVTNGSTGSCGNYLCNAGAGYDGPTGNGTPNGTGAF